MKKFLLTLLAMACMAPNPPVVENEWYWKDYLDSNGNPTRFVTDARFWGMRASCDADNDGTLDTGNKSNWFDNSAAMANALSYYAQFPDNIGKIEFPTGCFYFASTIDLDSPMFIVGDALGQAGGTRFVFNTDVLGIHVWGDTTTARANASGTVLKNLRLHSLGGTDQEAHGIRQGTRMEVYNVVIQAFPGNGLMAWCDINGTQDEMNGLALTHSNCNNSTWYNTEFVVNKHWGVYMKGGDSNGTEFFGCNFQGNDSGDIYEESFLGNSYYGYHVTSDNSQQGGDCDDPWVAGDETASGKYCSVQACEVAGAGNRSFFYGGYTEGSGTWRLYSGCSVIGNTSGGNFVGSGLGMLGNVIKQGTLEADNVTSSVSFHLGDWLADDWGLYAVEPASNHPHLRTTDYIRFGAYPFEDNEFAAMYGYCQGNTKAQCYHLIATGTTAGFSTDEDADHFKVGDQWFRGRIWVGNSATNNATSQKLAIDVCDGSPPSDATNHPEGSVCFNVSTSTHVGWILKGSTWESWGHD